MENYNALIAAVKIIQKARFDVHAAEGASPAWEMLYNASDYLTKQAKAAFRGEA